jgi:uncharacterized protein (DUF1330 family)
VPAYLIADVNVEKAETYAEYRRQVAPLVERYGGRFIVRGGAHETLEGGWRPARLVIIEFPSMAVLKGWYGSPEYKKLIALRQGASQGSLVAVEGAKGSGGPEVRRVATQNQTKARQLLRPWPAAQHIALGFAFFVVAQLEVVAIGRRLE